MPSDSISKPSNLKLSPNKLSIPVVILLQLVASFVFSIGATRYTENMEAGVILIALAILMSIYALVRAYVKKYSMIININKNRISYKYGLFRGSIRVDKIEEIYTAVRVVHLVGDSRQITLPYEAFDDEGKKILT